MSGNLLRYAMPPGDPSNALVEPGVSPYPQYNASLPGALLQVPGLEGLPLEVQRYFQQNPAALQQYLANPRMADTWRRTPDMQADGYTFGRGVPIPSRAPPGTYTGPIQTPSDDFGSKRMELPNDYYVAKGMMGDAPQQMNQLLQAAYLRRGYRT